MFVKLSLTAVSGMAGFGAADASGRPSCRPESLGRVQPAISCHIGSVLLDGQQVRHESPSSNRSANVQFQRKIGHVGSGRQPPLSVCGYRAPRDLLRSSTGLRGSAVRS
jgi:hypothetical protein